MSLISLFCFIINLINSIFQCQVDSPFSLAKWKIDFFPPKISSLEPRPNYFILKKGRYLNVTIKATSLNHNEEHYTTNISLIKHKYVQTTEAKYLIDTNEQLEVSMFIGVPCLSETITNEVIQFFTSTIILFRISEVTIKTIDDFPSPIKIVFRPLEIIPNSYGKVLLANDLYNVDAIQVTIENKKIKTGDYYSMDDFIISPFRNDKLHKKEKEVLTTYYLKKYYPDSDTLSFSLSLNNTCHTIIDKFNISQKLEAIPNAKDLELNLIKTTKLQRAPAIKELNIRLNIAITPIERFCVVTDMKTEFMDDDAIIDRTEKEIMTKLRYGYEYIEKKTVKLFKLRGLSHHIPYKMKCVFRTPMIKDSTKISMTFGLFDNADVKVPVEAEIFEPTPAHCFTWRFETKLTDTEFREKALNYCSKYFSKQDKYYNGCLECVSRDISKLSEVFEVNESQSLESICIKSSDNCQSRFSEDISRMVNEFKETLSTNIKIAEKLNLSEEKYKLNAIFIEDDTNQPDLSKLIINRDDIKIESSSLAFKIYYSENKKIGCYFMVTKQSTIGLSPYELINNEMHVIDSRGKRIGVKFSNDIWDEKLYNLVVMCYNIPFFDYNFKYRHIKTIIQFVKTQSSSPIKPNLILPLDCSGIGNKNKIECQAISHHSLNKLNGCNPYKPNIGIVKEYVGKSYQDKRISLGELINKASIEDSLLKKLNQCLTVNDIIETTHCRNEIDYIDCIKFKKDVMAAMIVIPYNIIGNKNIVDNLRKSNKIPKEEQAKETNSNIKLSLMVIFYLINNPDSFDENSTKMLFEMIKSVNDHIDELLLEITGQDKEKETKDLIMLIAQYLSNFSDILKFNELEGLFDNEIDQETFIIKNNMVNELVSIINRHTDKMITLANENKTNFKLDKLTYRIYTCIYLII